MEITQLEIVLFLYAVFITVAWSQRGKKERDELSRAKQLIWLMLEEPLAREQIIESHQQFKAIARSARREAAK